MPALLTSKERVLELLLEAFRRNGYDGASLAVLSEATGLGKSSLYHYFPDGKAGMALQVLDLVEVWMGQEVVEPLGDKGVAPPERLERMLATLSAFYEGGKKACILGRLSASVDRSKFQRRLERIFAMWIAALTRLLVEVGHSRAQARREAEEVVLRIQGALVLSASLDDERPFRRVIEDLRTNLL